MSAMGTDLIPTTSLSALVNTSSKVAHVLLTGNLLTDAAVTLNNDGWVLLVIKIDAQHY